MERKQAGTLDMTEGSPARVLLLFAVPVILSNLFQQLYNLVDSLIVGNYLGPNALAAVGSAGTITAVVIQLASGLSLGASVVISQYFGAGKREKIRVCMTTICLFSVAAGAVVTLLTQVFAEDILRLVLTPEEVMADSIAYLTVYFWGSVVIFLYNALNAVYIAVGDSRTPLYFLILAFFLNVAGDLFFIVNCSMGVRGGALASTLSQAVCTVLSWMVLEWRMRKVDMAHAERLFDRAEFWKMMKIALPAALQQSVVSVGNVCVQAATNSFGAVVMAGCTAANKAISLVSLIPINWGSALANYTGQNVGAKKPDRIRAGVRVSVWVTGLLTAFLVLFLELMPEQIVGWFVEEDGGAAVVAVGAEYLRATGPFLIIFAVYMVVKDVFKGTGDMKWYVGMTLSSLGIRVAFTFFFAPVLGVPALWWGVCAGWIISAVPTLLHYTSGKWYDVHESNEQCERR